MGRIRPRSWRAGTQGVSDLALLSITRRGTREHISWSPRYFHSPRLEEWLIQEMRPGS